MINGLVFYFFLHNLKMTSVFGLKVVLIDCYWKFSEIGNMYLPMNISVSNVLCFFFFFC